MVKCNIFIKMNNKIKNNEKNMDIDNKVDLKIENIKDNNLMNILSKFSPKERRILHKLQLERAIEKRTQLRSLRAFENNVTAKNHYIRRIKSKS